MLFGGQVEALEQQMENFHLILTFLLVAILGVVFFRMIVRRRVQQAEALAHGAPKGPSEGQDG